MSENVRCPMCGKRARWMGCVGCGDDSGTLVCQSCGATIPGMTLGEIDRRWTDAGVEKPNIPPRGVVARAPSDSRR